MMRGLRAHRVVRLRDRLAEGARGNPKFRLGETEQTHEDELDEDEVEHRRHWAGPDGWRYA